MNKEEHLLFLICLFIFTLTVGRSWIEEYLGTTYEGFESSNIKNPDSNAADDIADDSPVAISSEFENELESFISSLKTQTNNDKFSTQDLQSNRKVLESFAQRGIKKDQVNIY